MGDELVALVARILRLAQFKVLDETLGFKAYRRAHGRSVSSQMPGVAPHVFRAAETRFGRLATELVGSLASALRRMLDQYVEPETSLPLHPAPMFRDASSAPSDVAYRRDQFALPFAGSTVHPGPRRAPCASSYYAFRRLDDVTGRPPHAGGVCGPVENGPRLGRT